MPEESSKLRELARKRFAPRQLSTAEERLFRAVEAGEEASALVGNKEQDDPANAANWNADRVLRAESIVWLCTDSEALMLVTHRGLVIAGMRIEGELDLDGVDLKFRLVIWKCRMSGDISFRDAELRVLVLDGCHVNNLSADRMKVQGAVFLRHGFKAEGTVSFSGATIGGNLDCVGSEFSCVNAEGARIEGHAFLRNGFKADGEVSFLGATIGGALVVNKTRTSEKMILDLRMATVGTLWDDEASWPTEGNLFLDGFVGKRFDEESPIDADSRKRWLQRQPRQKFLPQPYEQLAKVFREMGNERGAKLVMIEKNREQSRFTRRFRQEWWWYNFFGPMIGYGYRPAWAFWGSLAVTMIGALLFYAGFSYDLISPTKDTAYVKDATGRFVTFKDKPVLADQYPPFTPIAYSVESFTPFLKLDQKENWIPNSNRGSTVGPSSWHVTTGQLLLWYLRWHIIFGWILTTLWVGAVTGLVKT